MRRDTHMAGVVAAHEPACASVRRGTGVRVAAAHRAARQSVDRPPARPLARPWLLLLLQLLLLATGASRRLLSVGGREAH